MFWDLAESSRKWAERQKEEKKAKEEAAPGAGQ
jgi:hypothetical protein